VQYGNGNYASMNNEEMQTLLDEVIALHANPSSSSISIYMEKMHPLAEAQYEAAKRFFIDCLDDERLDWRYDCLNAVGFHYDLSSDESVKDKLRDLLLHDEDDLIRSASARILEINSTWLDEALFTALETESDRSVKIAVFAALLKHGGLPGSMYLKTYAKLKNGEIEPSLSELKRMLGSLNLFPEFPKQAGE
jgi:hypothetical protein